MDGNLNCERHTNRGSSPMCGSTICQDRRFLARHMPALEAWFHYRNIDVSTVKELAGRVLRPIRYSTMRKRRGSTE